MNDKIVICGNARQAAEMIHEISKYEVKPQGSVFGRLGRRLEPASTHQQLPTPDRKPATPRNFHSRSIPMYKGKGVIADSIGVRWLRLADGRRPKDSPVCRGGLTIPAARKGAQTITHFPQEVIIQLGTNDVLNKWPIKSIVQNFYQLLVDLDVYGVKKVYLISVPPVASAKWSPANQRIVNFNTELKKFAETDETIAFVDIHKFFTSETGHVKHELYEKCFQSQKFADQVHPNKEGLQVILEEIDFYVDGI